ncbi:hypothetical protein Rcae01_06608 [Novipirellula caenicola]|uniref:Uncharacterized protein n=1 Tax=Novipirellula caenicola TaxID=1536901 RepID=A0ABP9W142_9BACT
MQGDRVLEVERASSRSLALPGRFLRPTPTQRGGKFSSLLTPHSPSPCLRVSVSPCLPVSLSPCLPVSLSPCLPVSLSPCLPVSLSRTRFPKVELVAVTTILRCFRGQSDFLLPLFLVQMPLRR